MKEFLSFAASSPIKIPAGFWWGVLAGVIPTVVIVILKGLFSGVNTLLKMYRRFTLAGVWIGTCTLPNYSSGVEAVEIYRLKTTGDHVTFKFFNYCPGRDEIIRYQGAGICRSQLFSAFYYVPDRDRAESGVFSVRKIGDQLKGTYSQYDLGANEKLLQSPEVFVLSRIRIPFIARVRMRLNRPPYRTHDQVRERYDREVTKQALPKASTAEPK